MKTLLTAHKEPGYFNVIALCLLCRHKWIGMVEVETSLFTLQCPACGTQDSFASFLPDDYLEEFSDRKKPEVNE